MKLVTVSVISAVLCAITAFGQSGNEPSLKVKGLYIGMDIKDVPSVLKQKLPPGVGKNVSDVLDGRRVEIYGNVGFIEPCVVTADSQGKVTNIWFDYRVVIPLFNVDGMEISTFVETFSKAYNISMSMSDDMNKWIYTSPDGTKVTISTEKDLIMQKVPSASEQIQSFD